MARAENDTTVHHGRKKRVMLVDDEIDVIEGKRDQLVGKIQERYGIAKDQAEKDVDKWARDF